MPANGLAASWNHLSSAVCWSLVSVVGWNSANHLGIAAERSTAAAAGAAGPDPGGALPLPAPGSGGFLLNRAAASSAKAAVFAVAPNRHCQLRYAVLVCMCFILVRGGS